MAIAVIGLAFQGCSDDDNDNDNINVDDNYKSAFEQLYPGVGNVTWERKGNYYVADFWRTEFNAGAEAWFDNAAAWELTVTDITYQALPQAVRTAFEASEYAAWRVDDVDMIERKGMEVIYVIEVEKGNVEFDLFYAPDGTLIKAVEDKDNNGGDDHSGYIPGDVPQTVSQFIATKYPGAKILETEVERDEIEVDILDGRTYRDVHFTLTGEWKYTKTEVRAAEVPQNVMDAFKASEYASYEIDDIDLYDSPQGEFYIFELDAEPHDIHLKITLDGKVEVVTKP